MEIQQQIPRDKEEEEEEKQSESKRDVHQTKQQALQLNPSSPTSPSSSPSHEFSFTISVHPSISKIPDKNTNPNSAIAIDLSPADEIFFHGHLLPLHLLSNLPVSPRSSTNSLDSFTLPIHELLQEENKNSTKPTSNDSLEYPTSQETNSPPRKPRGKYSKSLSFLKLSKWKKGYCESRQVLDQETGEKGKRKSKLDVLKRYARMVKPFLSFRNHHQLIDDRQSYSFSGSLRVKNNKELRGRRREFSAPASFTTSPTNSGPLVAKGTLTPNSSTVDSTMEELQAAIQAAIAHCKKSIAIEDKIKNP